MDKNKYGQEYMTKPEQMVFRALKGADLVTASSAEDAFPLISVGKMRKVLSGLASKGYLHRLKRGTYIVNEIPGGAPMIKDPLAVAARLFKGYIGLSSALKAHGLWDYETFTTYVITPNKSGKARLGKYSFQAIAMGKKALGAEPRAGYYVSNLEKTFFDCFCRPQYVGYGEIAKALSQADLSWDKFISYFREFASPSMIRRTGYALSIMKRRGMAKIPDNALLYFKSGPKAKARLMPSSKAGGKYDKEWMVLDNVRLCDALG